MKTTFIQFKFINNTLLCALLLGVVAKSILWSMSILATQITERYIGIAMQIRMWNTRAIHR